LRGTYRWRRPRTGRPLKRALQGRSLTQCEEGLAVIDRRLETTAGAVTSYVTS
jgi:hypothetical protein